MEKIIEMTDLLNDPESEISAYLFEELEPEARAAFEARLAASPALQAELAELRKTLAFIEERFNAAPEIELTPEARQRLAESAASIEITPVNQARKRPRRALMWTLGSLAAAACAALLLIPTLQETRHGRIESDSAPAPALKIAPANHPRMDAPGRPEALPAAPVTAVSSIPAPAEAPHAEVSTGVSVIKASEIARNGERERKQSLDTGRLASAPTRVPTHGGPPQSAQYRDDGLLMKGQAKKEGMGASGVLAEPSAKPGTTQPLARQNLPRPTTAAAAPSAGSNAAGVKAEALVQSALRPTRKAVIDSKESEASAGKDDKDDMKRKAPLGSLDERILADANMPGQTVQLTAPPATPVPSPADMYFQDYGVNPFVDAKSDPLSTFAIDVDTASYTVARNYLNRGMLPPAAAIRVEEVINYFPEAYAPPENAPFAIHGTMIPSPFGKGFQLLRVGIKAKTPDAADRKPLILTFVIDTSGSMAREDRLGLVKRTLQTLVARLRPTDQVGIAVYESNAREVLPHTAIRETGRILAAINDLHTGGSTNVNEGLEVGYTMARHAFRKEAVNRVILCSDGVANNGATNPDLMLGNVARNAGDDIHLTCLGVGMGNMNDVLLETLADKGNGEYAYLDSDEEAGRFIERRLAGGMEVVAQDAKIQVEFDAAQVRQYRLIGFENRDVADADFRNDAVDAGEIMSGHAVTALYELELAGGGPEGVLGTVRLRFKQPAHGLEVIELNQPLDAGAITTTFEKSDAHMRLVTLAAEYGEILRNSYWARDGRMEKVAELFDEAFPANPPGEEAAELRGLIGLAAPLTANRPAPVRPTGPRKGAPPTQPNGGGPGDD